MTLAIDFALYNTREIALSLPANNERDGGAGDRGRH